MKTNDDIAREEYAMKAAKKGGKAVKRAAGGDGRFLGCGPAPKVPENMRAPKPPPCKTGGAVKKAAGGVGKIRHQQATKAGKPLTRAEYNKKRI